MDSRTADSTRRIAHWDDLAGEARNRFSRYYHQRLTQVYRHLVAEGQRVLELGCGLGDLLASLNPSFGLGVDFSRRMIREASRRHPQLRFVHADVHELPVTDRFDLIILSDLIHDLWDVQAVLEQAARVSHHRTRLIINSYSRLWEVPLGIVERAGLAKPVINRNWLTVEDVGDLLRLAGFEIVRHWSEILWPMPTPVIEGLLNRFLVRFSPFSSGALTNFIVARPLWKTSSTREPRVSVVVPARNEAGNVPQIFDRIPELGHGLDLIFVEGGSTDGTIEAIEREAKRRSFDCKIIRQPGVGKGDAVRTGFDHAEGDVLMILDADLTVPPEDLPRFYDALVSGKGELINGVRMVYPMEEGAMRLFNFLGNKFFSLAFSWLLGQPVKDTLCGTKVLWRSDYQLISQERSYFGDFDPFGDFDLLLGAARLNLKILGLPIRYRERAYGETNISRWSHGAILLRMLGFASRKLKFV